MSVVTNYDQQNKGHQGFQQPPKTHSFPNTPETSQNTDIAAPFLGQYIMQVINMELNRRLALLNLPNIKPDGVVALS